MPKEYGCYDNVTAVAGLKKKDTILFIGSNASFPWLKRAVRSIDYVKKGGELKKLISNGRQFDRIFIARENVLAEELVIKAAQLSRTPESLQDSEGLICFFSEDDGLRNAFVEIVEKNYPLADIWPMNSNVGPVVVTNAKGNPIGME